MSSSFFLCLPSCYHYVLFPGVAFCPFVVLFLLPRDQDSRSLILYTFQFLINPPLLPEPPKKHFIKHKTQCWIYSIHPGLFPSTWYFLTNRRLVLVTSSSAPNPKWAMLSHDSFPLTTPRSFRRFTTSNNLVQAPLSFKPPPPSSPFFKLFRFLAGDVRSATGETDDEAFTLRPQSINHPCEAVGRSFCGTQRHFVFWVISRVVGVTFLWWWVLLLVASGYWL